jgi:hypothetical protein
LGALGGGADVQNAEARIGIIWFSRIGMLLILVSAIIGYLMLSNSWLQAGIGWLAGGLFVGLSWWGHRRGYRYWSQAVAGGGVGLLYLVTTTAHTVFAPPILGAVPAFGLMAAITVLGTYLAVRYDSIVVGLLAMVGGFATPFLISSDQGTFAVLFTYVAILDVGLLGVAWFKRWPLYNYLLFAVTWLIYGTWRGTAYTPDDGPLAFLFTGVYFAIFAAVALAYNVHRQEKSRYQDLAMVLTNGFVFFASGLDLLDGLFVRALFAFAMAAAQFSLGTVVRRHNPTDRLMHLSFLGLAGIFLTIAFPVALQGPWISVAWALEAAALVWIGFITGESWTRPAGLGLFGLAVTGLLTWETYPDLYQVAVTWEMLPGVAQLLPGEGPLQWAVTLAGIALRGFTFLTSIGAVYAAVVAYHRFGGPRRAMQGLASVASFLTLWYLTFELTLFFDTAVPVAAAHERLAIAATWALYGLALAAVERRLQGAPLRNGARLVLGGSLVYLVVACLLGNAVAAFAPFRLAAFAVVLGAIWLGEYWLRTRGAADETQGVVSLAAALVGFFVGAFEVRQWMGLAHSRVLFPVGEVFATAALWGAYAAVVMVIGGRLRSAGTRILGAVLSAVAQVYVLALGLTGSGADPLLRTLAFITTVPGTYLAVYLARRSGTGRYPSEAAILRWTVLGAAALTAVWGAVELNAALWPLQAIPAVLIWGGVYGLAVLVAGLKLAAREARWLAVGVLVITLAAVPWTLLEGQGLLAPVWLQVTAAAVLMASCGTAAWLTNRPGAQVPPGEARNVRWLTLAAALDMALWGALKLQAPAVVLGSSPLLRSPWLLWTSLYGLAVLGAGLRLRWTGLRYLGLGLVAVAGVLAVGAPVSGEWERLLLFGVTAGAVYLAAAVVLRMARNRVTADERVYVEWGALAMAALTPLSIWNAVMALPLPGATTRDFLFSAAIAGYGFVVLAVGFGLRHRYTRLLAIGILGLTLVKVAVYDMWSLALVWRVWIGAGIGTMLVAASLAYQRFARLIVGESPQASSSSDTPPIA